MKKIKITLPVVIIVLVSTLVVTLLTIIIKPEESFSELELPFGSKTETENDLSYLKISNVSLSSNSSYNICSGTISVPSYSPYKYHYVKVKGAFTTSYGTTIDTDWTYAIGSEWLEPGESTKFRLSVEKDYSISNCKVSIMED